MSFTRRKLFQGAAAAGALAAVGLPAVVDAALAEPVGSVVEVALTQRLDLHDAPWMLYTVAVFPDGMTRECCMLTQTEPVPGETPTHFLARPDTKYERDSIAHVMRRAGMKRAHFVDHCLPGQGSTWEMRAQGCR